MDWARSSKEEAFLAVRYSLNLSFLLLFVEVASEFLLRRKGMAVGSRLESWFGGSVFGGIEAVDIQ